MPTLCCVPGCKSNNINTPEYITNFKFPKDAELQIKWLRAIKRPSLKVSASTNVCIKHFAEKDIKKGEFFFINGIKTFLPNKRWKLVQGAIPTIFLDGPYLSRVIVNIREDPEIELKRDIIAQEEEDPLWIDPNISIEDSQKRARAEYNSPIVEKKRKRNRKVQEAEDQLWIDPDKITSIEDSQKRAKAEYNSLRSKRSTMDRSR